MLTALHCQCLRIENITLSEFYKINKIGLCFNSLGTYSDCSRSKRYQNSRIIGKLTYTTRQSEFA